MSILETKDTLMTIAEPLKGVRYSTASPGLFKGFKRRALVWGTLALGDMTAVLLSPPIAQAIGGVVLPVGLDAGVSLPALAVIAFYAILGLYAEWGLSPVERLRIRALGSIAYLTISTVLIFSSGASVATLSTAALTAVLLFFIGHYVDYAVRKFLVHWRIWGVPTLIIGAQSSQSLAKFFLEHPDLGLRPIGIVCDQPSSSIQVTHTSIPTFAHVSDTPGLNQDAEIALVTKDQINKIDNLKTLPFDHIILVHDKHVGLGFGLHAREPGEAIGADLQRGIYKRRSLLIKRAFDLAVSVPLAILTSPLMLVLLLAIKFIDPGPGLFWQSRVGQYGRTIRVCKLRTMYLDAEQQLERHLANCPEAREEWNTHFKLQNDPRILPVIGNFIRRYSLDELPQILNVVQGCMSLVGPRPFPEYHLRSFDGAFQDLRASVPPGLTGFWQVSARSDGNLSVQKTQDTLYIQNWSPWLDLWILLQTIPAVLTAKGAR